MATQVQLRGGTTSEHSTFTGAVREVTVDTTKDTVVVHDGSTAGGIPLAKEASVLPLAGGTMTGNITLGTNTIDGLEINTTATSNLGLGTGAVDSIATGDYNVGVGDGALTATTTGDSNTAVGLQALKFNTTGTYNTASGSYALYSNTTGNYNTAVGVQSLYSNTTGYNNTANGYQALYYNTTGYQNTATGMYALQLNTTGFNNVAVGREALESNTTGAGNIAIGYLAGDGVTTGLNNTLIGKDVTEGILTTGSSNVIIGAFARPTTAATASAVGMGYNIVTEGGYTTVGDSANDIRAAHGVATWATVSDRRYKKDIVDSTVGLSFVNALQPRTFKYKNKGELPETFRAYKADSTEVFKNSNTNHGFIAQEVKAAIDADAGIKDGFRMWDDREDGSQEVAEAALIPVLVKAIQELTAKVEALEAQLNA